MNKQKQLENTRVFVDQAVPPAPAPSTQLWREESTWSSPLPAAPTPPSLATPIPEAGAGLRFPRCYPWRRVSSLSCSPGRLLGAPEAWSMPLQGGDLSWGLHWDPIWRTSSLDAMGWGRACPRRPEGRNMAAWAPQHLRPLCRSLRPSLSVRGPRSGRLWLRPGWERLRIRRLVGVR